MSTVELDGFYGDYEENKKARNKSGKDLDRSTICPDPPSGQYDIRTVCRPPVSWSS